MTFTHLTFFGSELARIQAMEAITDKNVTVLRASAIVEVGMVRIHYLIVGRVSLEQLTIMATSLIKAVIRWMQNSSTN